MAPQMTFKEQDVRSSATTASSIVTGASCAAGQKSRKELCSRFSPFNSNVREDRGEQGRGQFHKIGLFREVEMDLKD